MEAFYSESSKGHPRQQIKRFLEKLGLLKVAYRIRELFQATALLTKNAPYWIGHSPDRRPIPPLKLISLVTGTPNIPWFLESGKLGFESILQTLHDNKISTGDFEAILDFGCGCGRVIRYWAFLEKEIHGTDLNQALIDWCARNLSFAKFQTNLIHPPLSFPDNKFSFIYALSVFTHLPESLQQDWMREFNRILKPEGYLLLTVHGEYYLNQLYEAERQLFHSGQLVVRSLDIPGSNKFGVYHPLKFVREKLANNFEIVDFIPEGAKGNPYQDIFLMRKPGAQTSSLH